MSYQNILYDVTDRVATITLNRPEIFNAMGPVMMNEIIAAFDAADADDDVRAIVVTGAGKGFCGGADLSKGADIFDKDKKVEGREAGSARRADSAPRRLRARSRTKQPRCRLH